MKVSSSSSSSSSFSSWPSDEPLEESRAPSHQVLSLTSPPTSSPLVGQGALGAPLRQPCQPSRKRASLSIQNAPQALFVLATT